MARTVLFALVAISLMAAEPPTVTITGGVVRGSLLEQGGAAFRGIPFAHPPVGDLRWRPPLPAKAWDGVRDATRFSAPCAQNSGGRMLEGSSEDCLYLNIWTPVWPPKPGPPQPRLPVMFWIHGGGNYGGTASTDNFDGESLARHGVVVVTANYRLTIFGFLAHPELTRESPRHSSGNYGLLDQIAALEWVRGNIARFGGDPGNVTVFGQSAGAVDANVLMTSPLAKGLFHRVIAESGTVTRSPDATALAMTALGAVMQVKSGPVTYSDASELAEAEQAGRRLGASLEELRALPAEGILKLVAAPRMSIGPANGIIVDGWVIPKAPAEVFVKGEQSRLPLLVGNNARERTPPQSTSDDLNKAAEAMYGPLAERFVALYDSPRAPARDADPLYGGTAAQWVVDTMYRCPVVAQLLWHTEAGNPAYEYQFDHAAPGREALGAVHGAEVPFVFGLVGRAILSPANGKAPYTAVDQDISAALQQYWTNFAKTGNPNGGGVPQWPRFDSTARGYIEFTDSGPVAREGLRRPFCDLYVENVKRLISRETPIPKPRP
jgi:para-nitrobenzyl esterase